MLAALRTLATIIAQALASLVGCLIPFLIMGLMCYVGGLVFWLLVGLITRLFQ